MDSKTKLMYCLIGNLVLLLLISIIVVVFKDEESTYMRFGPSDTLIIVSIRVNTWRKYCVILLGLGLVKSSEVIMNEIANPLLVFNIYNPDKKIIVEFTKNELQFFANSIFIASSLRYVLLTVISVTQMDLAIFSVLVSEVSSFFTIRLLLNEKEFKVIENEDDVLLNIV